VTRSERNEGRDMGEATAKTCEDRDHKHDDRHDGNTNIVKETRRGAEGSEENPREMRYI